MPNAKPLALTILLVLLGLFSSATVYGAPAAKLWPRWQAHEPDSPAIVDHADWDLILERYVDANHPSGISRFTYSSVSPQDRQALKDYLRKLQEVEVSGLNRDEQKAYWINLYNGLTVDIILDHYPVKSIRDIDISPGIFSSGPWDAKLLTIEGEKVSLNDIEHRILRPIWQDNRIHYAVNCASLGCPNLQPRAFTAPQLETMLDKAAGEFVNHPRGVSAASNRLQVSSIYFWFKEDFGDSEKGIIEHLKKYLSPENLEKIKAVSAKMSHQYNWDLNE
ncbi:MAG: hypothetical protein AMJ60_02875 [Desulfobacterales bacterium SG8_35]|nr:MAG: hypothetical protein AMJ60_02875 [Desulfobacterales bacterium SG8_35]